jgi:hypothetical protein
VRVKLRRGWRFTWVDGTAHLLPDDDPYARQRRISRWHPLRALNLAVVRIMGTNLLTIRIDLHTARQPDTLPENGGRRGWPIPVATRRATAASSPPRRSSWRSIHAVSQPRTRVSLPTEPDPAGLSSEAMPEPSSTRMGSSGRPPTPDLRGAFTLISGGRRAH